MRSLRPALVPFLAFSLIACAGDPAPGPLPITPPGQSAALAGEARISVETYPDPEAAQRAFGFDAAASGILPIQVVVDNRGMESLRVEADQTFLQDAEGRLWPLLDPQTTRKRAARGLSTRETLSQGAETGAWGAVGGAVLGAALALVTGDSVVTGAGKGAALGGGGGLVLGGVKGAADDAPERRLAYQLRDRSLLHKRMRPGALSHGVLFFPAEIPSARALILQFRESGSDAARRVLIPLTYPAAATP